MSAPLDRFRLTASGVAHFFQHNCDRLFRWEAVPPVLRGAPGIGSGIPTDVTGKRRPGAKQLMEMGEEFEAAKLQELRAAIGDRLLAGPDVRQGARTAPASIPLGQALDHLAAGPGFVAQPEIELTDDSAQAFARAIGFDPALVSIGAVRPDLIEALPTPPGEPTRLRLWDIKASERARHEHFAQVAFYALLLPFALPSSFVLDESQAVVWSKLGDEVFDLSPYMRVVRRFLRRRASSLMERRADAAHFHLCTTCSTCAFEPSCREQSEREVGLSRVPYLPSQAKRHLRDAGVATQGQLADLSALGLARVQKLSHELAVGAIRFQQAARALTVGGTWPAGRSTFHMPRREDVRLIVTAEFDAVTGTCFAAGLLAFEGFDGGAPVVGEHAFVAQEKADEGSVLSRLATAFADVLRRVDAVNREAEDSASEALSDAAQDRLDGAVVRLKVFKEAHPRLHSGLANVDQLREERANLEDAIRVAQKHLADVVRSEERDLRRRQKRVHFYTYDAFESNIIADALARCRHQWSGQQRTDARLLERFFCPPDLLPDPSRSTSSRVTNVESVLRELLVLPVAYQYDLESVSRALRPARSDGTPGGYALRLPPGFGWPGSNQIAFERAHDVWDEAAFEPDPDDWTQDVPDGAVALAVEQAVRSKLKAIDSVIRAAKQQLGERLLLRTVPFRLDESDDAFDPGLTALHTFVACEASHQADQGGATSLLTPNERGVRLVGIRGIRPEPLQPDPDVLWCTFDASCRDAKLDAGDFNLLLTNESEDLASLVGPPGSGIRGNLRARMVELESVERDADSPRLSLRPQTMEKLSDAVDLNAALSLDPLHTDYTTPRLLAVLDGLRRDPSAAGHVRALLETGDVPGWKPMVSPQLAVRLAGEVEAMARASGARRPMLNAGQRRAFEGVFGSPLSMVWGPPGTGKTHTLGHLLMGYVRAAHHLGRPLRIGVTAFTHHAIAGVLRKTASLTERYGIGPDHLRVAKVVSRSGHDADKGLPESVERWDQEAMGSRLAELGPLVTIVGATTWGTERALHHATGGAPAGWFDVLLVDEASQLLVPHAVMPLLATAPHASIILAGDDLQLLPIIQGTYPDEESRYGPLFGSIFAFARSRAQASGRVDQTLFLLEENFRMNAPITDYPSHALYEGRLHSAQPDLRLQLSATSDCPLCTALLDPERPVVLVRYAAPRAFTSRNELEARIAARIVDVLSRCLAFRESACSPADFALEGVGVLSPHRAQNSAIRSALVSSGFDPPSAPNLRPMPTVDTVDKLQGQERDAIIVSYGVADPAYAVAEGEFLFSRRRFNVAATRARTKLIVLVADELLDAVPTTREVLEDAAMLAGFADYCASGSETHVWTDDEFGDVPLAVSWRGFGE